MLSHAAPSIPDRPGRGRVGAAAAQIVRALIIANRGKTFNDFYNIPTPTVYIASSAFFHDALEGLNLESALMCS